MPLATGARLGPYEVVAAIGAGGMGEVYRARDTRLGRDVALKVLPEALAADPDRRERFEREARVLASLSHPNIAQIHGVEDGPPGEPGQAGVRALVMELVPGPTLDEHLAAHPISLDEALRIGRQIAEALAAAHDSQIVHRDLKPSNVKVTADGHVKVLDFGLAKALSRGDGEGGADQDAVATRTAAGTRIGTVLGTPAYMSPEQARGMPVDHRADIWAFGCVLYELLSRRRAFAGMTTTDVLAAILERDPDWTALPPATPDKVRDLLRRCLQKDANRRARDAGDLAIEIDEVLTAPPAATGTGRKQGRRPAPVLVILSVLAVAGAATLGFIAGRRGQESQASPLLARLSALLPEGDRLAIGPCPAVAVSPDGRVLAYIAVRQGQTQVYLRSMDSAAPRAVPGTEGVSDTVFFSPDGTWLGFLAGGDLKKVPTTGGSPVTLGATPGCGADWGPDDRIIIGRRDGLWQMSAVAAAPPRVLVRTRPDRDETGMYDPEFLPGGRAVLMTLATSRGFQIVVQPLETGERRMLIEDATVAHYLPAGYLVYGSAGRVLAAPFDAGRLELTGPSAPVLDGAAHTQAGGPQFGVARSGSTFVYVPGGIVETLSAPVWVDRRGSAAPLSVPPGSYLAPRLSPNGQKLALTHHGVNTWDIWIHDIARGTLSRLTTAGDNRMGVWSPDGARLAYTASVGVNAANLLSIAVDGSGAATRLTTKPDRIQIPTSWTPDGKSLVFTEINPGGPEQEIWVLPLDGTGTPRPFLQGSAAASSGALSPDGRWMAYASTESGRSEVYVRPFPGPGGTSQVSVDGGNEPVWAPKGGELFYRNGDKMMAVDVTTSGTFTAGIPHLLFEGRYASGGGVTYDVAPDGKRFVLLAPGTPPPPNTVINVVLGWLDDFRRRTAVR